MKTFLATIACVAALASAAAGQVGAVAHHQAGADEQHQREELVKRFAETRRQLKKEKNYAALANLPRDSSPTRSHNRSASSM